MRDYFALLRIKHYVKNLLLFAPCFFGGQIFNFEKMFLGGIGFIAFSLIASAVYIFNDLQDIENDRKHPVKKNRPLASGRITVNSAMIIILMCVLFSIAALWKIRNETAAILLLVYGFLNVAYSLGIKNVPILDIVVLSSGFIIRLFFGAVVTNIVISKWLYLVVLTGSFYMGLGKRRNELKRHLSTRKVLNYYTTAFLNQNMYVCVALANVFYALWASSLSDTRMSLTIPVFFVILMRYSLDIEGDSEGDPVDVIVNDRILQGMLFIYSVFILILLYFC